MNQIRFCFCKNVRANSARWSAAFTEENLWYAGKILGAAAIGLGAGTGTIHLSLGEAWLVCDFMTE